MVQERVAASRVNHEQVGEVLQKAMDARMVNHAKVLQVEKDRLKVIDDAALQARAEVELERKTQQELEARNLLAKQAMEEWELTTPPENAIQEFFIVSVDEATKTATLQDDERQ